MRRRNRPHLERLEKPTSRARGITEEKETLFSAQFISEIRAATETKDRGDENYQRRRILQKEVSKIGLFSSVKVPEVNLDKVRLI